MKNAKDAPVIDQFRMPTAYALEQLWLRPWSSNALRYAKHALRHALNHGLDVLDVLK